MEDGKTVLIVEDEMIIAKNMQNRLEGLGYRIPSIAISGEEAIRIAESTQPDLILMDIKLQGTVDGIQAADKIRNKLDIPVVFLTAYSDRAMLERAKATEPYGYLMKPFNIRELNSTIQIALYNHRQVSKLRDAAAKCRLLSGFIPICSGCKKVRSKEDWLDIEIYIKERSEADFTHSLCPECVEKYYRDFLDSI
ncbi:MAG: response regulator [candidate division Zixibacteria bacterium]|nr:response regulator [candidate division Zixibacteria bacterium]